MPDEPKQNIEEQLRTLAKQRREGAGAPFELPPAARERLQSEVERTFATPRATKDEPGLMGWLAGFGLRFAIGGVSFVVLALAAIFWLPGFIAPRVELAKNSTTPTDEARIARIETESLKNQETLLRGGFGRDPLKLDSLARSDAVMELVRQREADGDKPIEFFALTPEPATPMARAERATEKLVAPQIRGSVAAEKSGNDQLALRLPEAKTSVALSAREVNGPALAAPSQQLASSKSSPTGARGLTEDNRPADAPVRLQQAAQARQDSSSVLSVTTQPSVAFDSQTAVALRDEAKDLYRAEVAWSFQQTEARERYRRNFNSPPAPPVLNSFQVQQTGDQLRVTDADGSLYEGVFNPPVALQQEEAVIQTGDAPTQGGRSRRATGRGGFSARTASEGVASQASLANGPIVGRSFQVIGTNRTLNQRVVFNGQIQFTTNVAQAAFGREASGIAQSGRSVELQGTAKVGQSTEIPVRASGQRP